jgi:hypothetical protein
MDSIDRVLIIAPGVLLGVMPAFARGFRAFTFFSHGARRTTARDHLVVRRGEIAVGCFDFDDRVRIEGNRPRTTAYRTSVIYVHSKRDQRPPSLPPQPSC